MKKKDHTITTQNFKCTRQKEYVLSAVKLARCHSHHFYVLLETNMLLQFFSFALAPFLNSINTVTALIECVKTTLWLTCTNYHPKHLTH